jgi:hypothetical protein
MSERNRHMTYEELVKFVGIYEGRINGIICPRCNLMSEEQMCIDQGWCWNCRTWTTDKKKKEAV